MLLSTAQKYKKKAVIFVFMLKNIFVSEKISVKIA